MTEGRSLPKSDYLNWWTIWTMKDFLKKQKKIQLKPEKNKLNMKVFKMGKKLEYQIVFAF